MANYTDATRAAPQTDFVGHSGVTSITPDTVTGEHYVRINKTATFSDNNKIGELIYLFNLDTELDEVTQTMRKLYERYSISEIEVNVQATSPFGTSSGSMQVAMFPDPSNIDFVVDPDSDDLPKNVTKIVRQANSKLVRPRESVILKVDTEGSLYTVPVGDARLWSFGGVAFVVRTTPDAGDSVEFAITLSAKYNFHRPCVYDRTTDATTVTILPRTITHDPVTHKVIFDLATFRLPRRVKFNLSSRLQFEIRTPSLRKIFKLRSLEVLKSPNDPSMYCFSLTDVYPDLTFSNMIPVLELPFITFVC